MEGKRRVRWWFFACLVMSCLESFTVLGRRKSVTVINYSSKVAVCDDDLSRSLIDTKDLRPVRINETIAMLVGSFELKKPFQDIVKIVVYIEKATPIGGKELIATQTMENLCVELARRNQSNLYSGYLRVMTMPNCPVPPGTYDIINMVADTSQVPTSTLMLGIYQITFNFYQTEISGKGLLAMSKDRKLGCITFECTLEPGS